MTQYQDDRKPLRPEWMEELLTFYIGRIARQYILHFNINDLVFDINGELDTARGQYKRTGEVICDQDRPLTVRKYLHQFLFERLKCQAIYTYSLAGGLIADDQYQNDVGTPLGQELRGPAMQRIYEVAKSLRLTSRRRGQPSEGQEVNLPDDIAENFKLLGHILRQQYFEQSAAPSQGQETQVVTGRTPISPAVSNANANQNETPVAVILDFAEKLIPFQVEDGQGDRDQLKALEVIQRWALDPLIRQTKNIIVLLTTNIGSIPTSVYAEGSGCKAIRVPLPDEGERASFIRFLMTRASPRLTPLSPVDYPGGAGLQANQLARATQGMRLTDIDNISRRVYVEFHKNRAAMNAQGIETPMIKASDIQRAKSDAIQAQSADLLEVVPPVRGFSEIGGLDSLKQYLDKRTALMRLRSQSPLVPNGLLLAGPPGTGKTIIAEALAVASGFNLVKMRSIQDKWIGSSERNLELVLNLLKDLHPVIVFIDEIDQAMVRRDTGQSGDSGVGARMFARILEEMSKAENRGNIMWVAATNRADLLDAALLRRFDRVIPLLTPDVHESCRIFAVMPDTIAKHSGNSFQVVYGGDLAQSGNKDVMKRPAPIPDDLAKFLPVAKITSELGITGAGIEIIVRRAIEMAYEELLDAAAKEEMVEDLSKSMPVIELRHLQAAIMDFKPNYDRKTYDYQSLLAIRACNFYSVIPPLPDSGIYAGIQNGDGRIDSNRLEEAIIELRSSGAR